MRRVACVFWVAILLLCGVAASGADLQSHPVVRVRSVDAIGTGVCFLRTDSAAYILTNTHVCLNDSDVVNQSMSVEYFCKGHKSGLFGAKVISADKTTDVAVLEASYEQIAPPVPLPIGDFQPQDGEMVMLYGCAHGEWPSCTIGHVTLGPEFAAYRQKYNAMTFEPTPAMGHSGSPILDATGTAIVGLNRARFGDDSDGIAIPGSVLRAVLTQKTSLRIETTQCIGGSCPVSPPRQFSVIGGNYYSSPQYQQTPRGSAPPQSPSIPIPSYPTLPSTVISPGSSGSDLAPVAGRLDALEQSGTAIQHQVAGLEGRVATIEAIPDLRPGLEQAASEIAALKQRPVIDPSAVVADARDAAKDTVDSQKDGWIDAAAKAAEDSVWKVAKDWLLSKGIVFGGGGLIALWFAWSYLKKKLDELDGKKDGRVDFRGLYYNAKEAIDRRDGRMDWRYHEGYGPYDEGSIRQYGDPRKPQAPSSESGA